MTEVIMSVGLLITYFMYVNTLSNNYNKRINKLELEILDLKEEIKDLKDDIYINK